MNIGFLLPINWDDIGEVGPSIIQQLIIGGLELDEVYVLYKQYLEAKINEFTGSLTTIKLPTIVKELSSQQLP